MSKQIYLTIARAFIERRVTTARNDTVCTGDEVLLHGSRIAWRTPEGAVFVSLCGYNTFTTCVRVNTILDALQAGWRIASVRCQTLRLDLTTNDVEVIDAYAAYPVCGPLGMASLGAARNLARIERAEQAGQAGRA